MFQLLVKLLNDHGRVPTRDPESVGYDLYAPIAASIYPGYRSRLPLGIATAFTEGWIGKIFDRSSMGNKGITTLAGVIDWSYRGEWSVILLNTSDTKFEIECGCKIAQVVFSEVGIATPIVTDDLPASIRGYGGFGSTDLIAKLNKTGFARIAEAVPRMTIEEQILLKQWIDLPQTSPMSLALVALCDKYGL